MATTIPANLTNEWASIDAEAKATKGTLSLYDAHLELIRDRVERGILTQREATTLHDTALSLSAERASASGAPSTPFNSGLPNDLRTLIGKANALLATITPTTRHEDVQRELDGIAGWSEAVANANRTLRDRA